MSECPRTEDENRENARLIAAAPELLEACRRAASLLRTLMQMNHLIPENNSVLRECFAAIGRAEGKE